MKPKARVGLARLDTIDMLQAFKIILNVFSCKFGANFLCHAEPVAYPTTRRHATPYHSQGNHSQGKPERENEREGEREIL